MSQFFESIKLQDGKLHLIDFHNDRLNKTRKIFFEAASIIDLEKEITIPCDQKQGLHKVKITYRKFLESVEIEPYQIKRHNKVKLSINDKIEYSFKNSDRSCFLEDIENDIDDIIYVKNGHLTDATYSNLALYDGDFWYTPDTFLLNGVKRSKLIQINKLKETSIKPTDLMKFSKIAFINAMRDFEMIYSFEVIDFNLHLSLEK
jgi:4-amino-4-deoxychorismate lyase